MYKLLLWWIIFTPFSLILRLLLENMSDETLQMALQHRHFVFRFWKKIERGKRWKIRTCTERVKTMDTTLCALICSAELPITMISLTSRLAPVQHALSAKKKPTGADWCQRYQRHHKKPRCSLTAQPAVFGSLSDSPAIVHVFKIA